MNSATLGRFTHAAASSAQDMTPFSSVSMASKTNRAFSSSGKICNLFFEGLRSSESVLPMSPSFAMYFWKAGQETSRSPAPHIRWKTASALASLPRLALLVFSMQRNLAVCLSLTTRAQNSVMVMQPLPSLSKHSKRSLASSFSSPGRSDFAEAIIGRSLNVGTIWGSSASSSGPSGGKHSTSSGTMASAGVNVAPRCSSKPLASAGSPGSCGTPWDSLL
mmetsp:Transcript_12864/g.29181  ORF Transcript_12864/g.29181 Transcript_12864/m.29181 type:complete len:220 (-) Transcript_12864:200-859(-)